MSAACTIEPRMIVFSFVKPDAFLNMNDRDGWRKRVGRNIVWRDSTYFAATQCRNTTLRTEIPVAAQQQENP